MQRTGLAALTLLLSFAGSAVATTVVPLTFDELTAEADRVVHAQVAQVSSGYGLHLGQRAIVTTIELVEPVVVRGKPLERFQVFGGTVGEHTMTLQGQPTLEAGEEVILFLTSARVQCPYVGIWQGVFHVRDGQVFRGKHRVVDVVEGELILGLDTERGMTPEAFLREVQRAGKQPAQEQEPQEEQR